MSIENHSNYEVSKSASDKGPQMDRGHEAEALIFLALGYDVQ